MTVGNDLSSAVAELARLDSSRLMYGQDYTVDLQARTDSPRHDLPSLAAQCMIHPWMVRANDGGARRMHRPQEARRSGRAVLWGR